MQRARQPQGEPHDEADDDPPRGASPGFRRLARLNRPELRDLVREGRSVVPGDVAGGVYRGWNMARLTAFFGVRKFFKRFHEREAPDRTSEPEVEVTGENVLARQNPITERWRPRLGGRGWFPFRVLPPGSGEHPGLRHALVISYGAWPGRGPLNPVGRVTDFLVRPEVDRPGLLLGESHFAAAGRRALLEYFVLERTERVR